MSRIKMVDLDIDDQEIQNMFSAVTEMLGRVPNSYRTLARSALVAKMLVPSMQLFNVRERGAS